MTSLFGQPVFQLYALCSAILVVILYWLAFLTAGTRAKRKKILNAEDVKVNSGAELVETEHPDVARIQRAHRNSLENAVPFFVIGGLYSLTEPSLIWAQGFFFSFVALRLFHAGFYLRAKQPFRTLSFGLGAIVNLGMVVQVIRAVM
ncbi:MAG: MAPEG family protein [Myxococcota bacterium]